MHTTRHIADQALALSAAKADPQSAITELADLAGGDHRTVLEAMELCLASDVDPGTQYRALEWLVRAFGQPRTRQMPTVRQLVEAAFKGVNGPERGRHFLSALQVTMKDVTDAGRRSALLALLVMAAFLLLDRAAVTSAQVGPFQIKDLSLIQKALPVLFAYLIYDLSATGIRFLYSRAVHEEITRLIEPPLSATRLDRLLLPHSSPLYGPMYFGTDQRLNRIARLFTALLRLGSLLSVLLIEAYALYRLFKVFGDRDPLVWLSTAFSTGFVLFAAVILGASRTHIVSQWVAAARLRQA
jgi:hypothetical protein